MAIASLPSIETPLIPYARARRARSERFACLRRGVDIAERLFTQTNSTGSFHTEARFTDSWKEPVPVAPSSKNATVTWGDFFSRWLSADPTAMGMPPPTIPLAPRLPMEKSAMCMQPPRPPHYPVSLPRNSAIIRSNLIPLPMLCPCPRWVAVMRS